MTINLEKQESQKVQSELPPAEFVGRPGDLKFGISTNRMSRLPPLETTYGGCKSQ